MFGCFRFVNAIPFFLGLFVTVPDGRSQKTNTKATHIGYLGLAPRPPNKGFIEDLLFDLVASLPLLRAEIIQ